MKNTILLLGSTIICMCILTACGSASSRNDAMSPPEWQLNGGKSLPTSGSGRMGPLRGSPYHYEVWTDTGGARNAKLIWYGADQRGGAAFRAEWINPDDYLGRVGYYWGNGKHYTHYKNIYVDYDYTRSGSGTGGNYSYIGVYGWSRNSKASSANERLIEYYVVDDWFGSDTAPISPSVMGGDARKIGEITVDDATYDIYKGLRVRKPSIDGTKTFTQIFSVRRTLRNSGTISVTEHFKKWEELGLKLGNLYEAKFLVEAGGGAGWLDLSYLSLSQEEDPR